MIHQLCVFRMDRVYSCSYAKTSMINHQQNLFTALHFKIPVSISYNKICT